MDPRMPHMLMSINAPRNVRIADLCTVCSCSLFEDDHHLHVQRILRTQKVPYEHATPHEKRYKPLTHFIALCTLLQSNNLPSLSQEINKDICSHVTYPCYPNSLCGRKAAMSSIHSPYHFQCVLSTTSTSPNYPTPSPPSVPIPSPPDHVALPNAHGARGEDQARLPQRGAVAVQFDEASDQGILKPGRRHPKRVKRMKRCAGCESKV